jgi:hypothetical protein
MPNQLAITSPGTLVGPYDAASRGAGNGVDPAVHYSIPANRVRANAAAQRWRVATNLLSIKNCSHCMLFEVAWVLEPCVNVLTWLRVACAVRGGAEKEFLVAVLLLPLQSPSSNQ